MWFLRHSFVVALPCSKFHTNLILGRNSSSGHVAEFRMCQRGVIGVRVRSKQILSSWSIFRNFIPWYHSLFFYFIFISSFLCLSNTLSFLFPSKISKISCSGTEKLLLRARVWFVMGQYGPGKPRMLRST